jgi:hypothetical protein
MKYKIATINGVGGYAKIQKDTLAVKAFYLNFSAIKGGIIPVPYDFYFKMEFNPALDLFNFPIDENEDSRNIETTVSTTVGGKAIGTDFPNKLSDKVITTTIELKDHKEKTVQAGAFDSYLLSGNLTDQSELWYSPEAGYLIKVNDYLFLDKVFGDSVLSLNTSYNMELIKTNYDSNNPPPHTPSKPSGPTSGKVGEEYNYTTSTIDPDDDQIWYMWKWNEDKYSRWMGPYNSGNVCEASHTWTNKGTYQIQVKAKDSQDCETTWSDPLPVSMPKSKSVNLLHITFLQRLVNRFPFLEQLLDL